MQRVFSVEYTLSLSSTVTVVAYSASFMFGCTTGSLRDSYLFEAILEGSVAMLWPALNEFVDLPVGVYRATLAEVIAHFGQSTTQRIAMTARLEHIHELVRRTGSLQRFVIFGSYVTAALNPRDVDIFLVMQGGFQPRDAPSEAQPLFRHDTAQSELGASIFWVNAETSFADTEDLIIGWQTRPSARPSLRLSAAGAGSR